MAMMIAATKRTEVVEKRSAHLSTSVNLIIYKHNGLAYKRTLIHIFFWKGKQATNTGTLLYCWPFDNSLICALLVVRASRVVHIGDRDCLAVSLCTLYQPTEQVLTQAKQKAEEFTKRRG